MLVKPWAVIMEVRAHIFYTEILTNKETKWNEEN